MADHTPGPWLRAGRTVYALMHAGWRKGAEQFKNRITITVQHDGECSTAEALACAELIEASPELHEQLTLLVNTIAAHSTPQGVYPASDYPDIEYRLACSRAVLSKANGGLTSIGPIVRPLRCSWKVLPLSGKYYGTKIGIDGCEFGSISVWTDSNSAPRPSQRELNRLPPHMTVEDLTVDNHYEEEFDLSIACHIAALPELLDVVLKLTSAIEEFAITNTGNKDIIGSLSDAASAAISKANGRGV